MPADRRRLPVAIVLFGLLFASASPALAQDESPGPESSAQAGEATEPAATPAPRRVTPERGRNLALTLIEAKPSFFTGAFDVVRGRLDDTLLRRSLVADEHDDHAAMILVRNRDVTRPLQARLDEFDIHEDVKGTQTFLGSVVSQKAGLASSKFDRVGFVVAADTDFKGDEPPRIAGALDRLRRLQGVLLTARGVGTADVIVLYEIGARLSAVSKRAASIDTILRSSRLEPIAEGIILADAR